MPPRFLAAYNPEATVVGKRAISPTKVALFFAAAITPFAVTQVALGAKIGLPFAFALAGALGSKMSFAYSSLSYWNEISKRQRMIKSTSETPCDKNRRLLTESFNRQ
jgi:hypothetical protein